MSDKKPKHIKKENQKEVIRRSTNDLRQIVEKQNNKNHQHKRNRKQHNPVQWTEQEDKQLLDHIKTFGIENWLTIANEMPTKTIHECKSRYFNVLDPSITNDPFTIEEDVVIIQKIKEIGRDWIEISKCLPGKSPKAIKKRYISYLKNIYDNDNDNDHSSDDDKSDSDDKPDDDGLKQFVFNPLLRETD